jgi:hypothetical protein
MLTAQPTAYLFFLKMQTYHMLTAEPSIYDMLDFIEPYCRKLNVTKKANF